MLMGIEYSELDVVCQRLIISMVLKVHNSNDNFVMKK